MNQGESGVVFAFSVGFDMSTNTSIQILFWKPSNPWSSDTNSTPSLTATASLGVVDLVTTAGTFTSNTYATYTFIPGDVDEAGTWYARVSYTSISQHLYSDVATFSVGE